MAVQDFGGEVLGKKIRVLYGDHKHSVDVASALLAQWFSEDRVGAIFDMPNRVLRWPAISWQPSTFALPSAFTGKQRSDGQGLHQHGLSLGL